MDINSLLGGGGGGAPTSGASASLGSVVFGPANGAPNQTAILVGIGAVILAVLVLILTQK